MTATANISEARWYEILDRLVYDVVFPSVIHRILLPGPPGTGKSGWAQFQDAFPEHYRITMHQQLPPEDVLGTRDLDAVNGGTKSYWSDGPAVAAMRKGCPLVIDEIDAFSPEVRCMLHSLCDDREMASLTLPTGEVVKAKPGFCVIGTTNKTASSLPEALLDRFDLVLVADVPAKGILDTLPNDLGTYMMNSYTHKSSTFPRHRPEESIRRMISINKLTQHYGRTEAINLVMGAQSVDFHAAIVAAGHSTPS